MEERLVDGESGVGVGAGKENPSKDEDTDSAPTVQEALVEFCEKTTTRGLSRAVKEKSMVWKIIWYTATVLLLTFAVYQTSKLLIQYLEFQVVQMEHTESEVAYPFPSVTVCNLNPIRKYDHMSRRVTKYLPEHLQTRQKFYKYVTQLQKVYPSKSGLLEKVKSTVGFFHNIPKGLQSEFGHTQTDFINSCQVVVSKGFNVYRTLECDDFRVIRSPLFFNCYTIYTNTTQAHNVTTLSLILYLNENENTVTLNGVSSQDIFGLYLGAKMVIHESDTFPDIDHASIKVGPGVSAWAVLQTKEWHKLGEPYEPCSRTKEINVTIEHNGTLMNYSRLGCRMECMQEVLAKRCGCLNPAWPMPAHFVSKYPYCMNISHNVTLFEYHMHCWVHVEEEDRSCKEVCHEKCHRFIYGQSMWTSKWPYISNHLAFYERYIKDKPYAPKFKVYGELLDRLKNGDKVETVSQELRKLDLIERNFIQINVHRNFELRTINERPSYGKDQLFSGVGGILSLSIGITLITIVEVIQLSYKLILAFRRQVRQGRSSDIRSSSATGFDGPAVGGMAAKYGLFPAYGSTTK